jgi:hypothetical protein
LCLYKPFYEYISVWVLYKNKWPKMHLNFIYFAFGLYVTIVNLLTNYVLPTFFDYKRN